MGIKVTTARFSTPTSTGSVNWTDTNLGGQTPKAAIFIFGNVISDGTAEDNLIGGIGFASGASNQFNSSIYSQTGVGTTNTWRNQDTDLCINQVVNGGSFSYTAALTSFISNGVTLNFTAINLTARLVTVIFFAGDDLTAHANFKSLGTELGAIDVTDPGFEPDLVFSSYVVLGDGGPGNNANLSFGAAINDGSDTNRGIAWCDLDDVGTSIVNCKVYTDAIGGQINNDSESYKLSIDDFDSSGFSFTQTTDSNDEANYLALSFGGKALVNLRSIDSPTATGDDVKSGVGFEPMFVLLGLTDVQTEDSLITDADAGGVGISCFTADAEFCNSWAAEDGQTTTDTQRLADNQAINFASGDGTTQFAATFDSFQNDGYTLNYTTADSTARKWFELSISEGFGSSSGRQSFSLPFFRGVRVGKGLTEIKGSLLEDADNFYTGDVQPQNLFGSLLSDADNLYHGIIDAPAPGNQSIIRSTFLNSSSLFHGLVRPTNMFGSLLEDSDTLNDGEIGGSRQLEGSIFEDSDDLYHGRIVLSLQDLEGSVLEDADILHHGALSFGDINISGSKLGDSILVLDSVTTNSATIESSHSINIPNGSNQTDRKLIVAVSANDSVTFTWPSGWSEILDTSTAAISLSVAHKTIDGTEGFGGSNDTITVTTSSSKVVTAIAYLVNENFADIEIDSATGTSTSPNPPSLTPSNGYDNYLNIAVIGHDSGSTSTTAYPSGFVNNQAVIAGTLTTGCGIAGSHLITPGSSIDPGAFTISQNRSWIAATISVRSQEVAVEDNIFHGSMIPEIAGTILTDSNTFNHGSLYRGVRVTSSQRNYRAGHEDPGVYTLDNSNDWIALTVAIR